VIARFILAGTDTGPYRGLPQPTGKQASMRTILIFRVVDGRIDRIGGVADRMEFLTQLGILPDIGWRGL
jgi:predicted ester cyclase